MPLSPGAILGLSIAGIVVVGLVVSLSVYFSVHARRVKQHTHDHPTSVPTPFLTGLGDTLTTTSIPSHIAPTQRVLSVAPLVVQLDGVQDLDNLHGVLPDDATAVILQGPGQTVTFPNLQLSVQGVPTGPRVVVFASGYFSGPKPRRLCQVDIRTNHVTTGSPTVWHHAC